MVTMAIVSALSVARSGRMTVGTLLGIWLLCTVVSSYPQQFETGKTKSSNQRAVGELSEAARDFTLNLIQAIRLVEGPNKNIFISPWSVSMGLAMLLYGSNGTTAYELAAALSFKRPISTFTMNDGYKALLQDIKGNYRDYTLEIANSVFLQSGYHVLPDFTLTMKEYYDATVHPPLDFKRSVVDARHGINNYVTVKTRGHIREFIPPGALSSDTLLYLLNVVYFSGTWIYNFDESLTKLKQFYTDSRHTVQVPMMNLEADLNAAYIPQLNGYGVELPYKGNRISMFLLMPEHIDGLRAMEEKITSHHLYGTLHTHLVNRKVTLSMPRFKIEDAVNLETVLQKLGVVTVFGPGADLTYMDPTGQLFVSTAIHKAVIEVNEKGTKAAAATGVGIRPLSGFYKPPDPLTINIDHPFMVFIYDWDTRMILFAGSIINPTESAPQKLTTTTKPTVPNNEHFAQQQNPINPFDNLSEKSLPPEAQRPQFSDKIQFPGPIA